MKNQKKRIMIQLETRVIDVTVGELLDKIKEMIAVEVKGCTKQEKVKE